MASLGTRTIRVVIGNYGSRYSAGYENCSGGLTLKQWVQSPEYQNLFNDPRFSTFIITYFTGAFGWANSITDPPNPAQGQPFRRIHTPPSNYNNAENQIKELVEYLVGQENGSFRFPGKTFILLNWEADSEFNYVYNDPRFISDTATYDPGNLVYEAFWAEYEKLIRAASKGAKDAIRPSGANQPKAYFGVEFSVISRFKDPINNCSGCKDKVKECGGGNYLSPDDRMEWRCVMSHLPKRLNQPLLPNYPTPAPIDYWSYSAYESTRSPALLNPEINLAQRVRDDLTSILGWISINRSPQHQANSLIIGEVGFSNNIITIDPDTGARVMNHHDRKNEGESYSAKFLRDSLNAFRSFGVSYVIHFQGTDAIAPNDFRNITDYSLFTGASTFFVSPPTPAFVRTSAGEAFARTSTSDITWIEDTIPATIQVYPPGITLQNINSTSTPRPLSGNTAFQTSLHTTGGEYIYYFEGASQTMSVSQGDTLTVYVFLDPANPPNELLLQWKAGPNQSDWNHRAYWGANLLVSSSWGTDGTASRRRIGDIPPAGKWVRLEVPANIVGLDNSTINGFSLVVTNGRAAFDRVGRMTGEFIWADDTIAGGQQGVYVEGLCGCPPYPWGEITNNPLPVSGTKAFQTGIINGYIHTQYFYNATQMKANAGDNLFAYAYLDPANPPETVMIQWHETNGTWDHRAYWGKPKITWSADGTAGNYYMGPLPPLGQWVRLEVLADLIGLAGKNVDGFGLALFSGRAAWDRVGKGTKDAVWLDDDADIPVASRQGQGANCSGSGCWNSPTITTPISGNHAFQTTSETDIHQIFTFGLQNTLTVNSGDTLFAYVYLEDDPNNRPRTLMLQWNDGNWEHRAYWGEDNLIPWGDSGPIDTLFNSLFTSLTPFPLPAPNYRHGTASRRFMGAVPQAGKWVRLEVPASRLGLEGRTLNGFAFSLYGGRGVFDRVGKVKNEHIDH